MFAVLRVKIDNAGAIVESIAEEMMREHSQHYANNPKQLRDQHGLTSWAGYTGRKADNDSPWMHQWLTSADNRLAVWREASDSFWIEVSGRRHGIPWRFLVKGLCKHGKSIIPLLESATVIESQSQSSNSVWMTGDGKGFVPDLAYAIIESTCAYCHRLAVGTVIDEGRVMKACMDHSGVPADCDAID